MGKNKLTWIVFIRRSEELSDGTYESVTRVLFADKDPAKCEEFMSNHPFCKYSDEYIFLARGILKP